MEAVGGGEGGGSFWLGVDVTYNSTYSTYNSTYSTYNSGPGLSMGHDEFIN